MLGVETSATSCNLPVFGTVISLRSSTRCLCFGERVLGPSGLAHRFVAGVFFDLDSRP